MTAADAIRELRQNTQSERVFWNDPYPCCGCQSDFGNEFDRRRRRLLGVIYNEALSKSAREYAIEGLQAWAP